PALPLRSLHGTPATPRTDRPTNGPTRRGRNRQPHPEDGIVTTSRADNAAGLLTPLHGTRSHKRDSERVRPGRTATGTAAQAAARTRASARSRQPIRETLVGIDGEQRVTVGAI